MKVHYRILSHGNIGSAIKALKSNPDITQVDVNAKKRVMRVIAPSLGYTDIAKIASQHGVELLEQPREDKKLHLVIDGMTCSSCEVLIEKKFKSLSGVKRVSVSAHKGSATVECDCDRLPSLGQFQEALGGSHYRVQRVQDAPLVSSALARPSFGRVLGFFVLAFAFALVLSKLGVFKTSVSISDGMTLGAAFVFGLIAASSACLATVGGLLLSSLAEASKRQVVTGVASRVLPTFLFIAGRLVSYLVFGGLIGIVGAAVSPSPLVTGGLVLLAAVYMIVMGLDMLGIAPTWLARLLPKMPKSIANRVVATGEGSHLFAPAFMGAATFFVPCGFTQALQLYALTLGNPIQSAALLGVFALGTSPALFALGLSFNLVKGKTKEFVFHFGGALIILMGVSNIQNGFTITGHPLSLPTLQLQGTTGVGPLAPMEGATQIMRMNVVDGGGYSPTQFTIRAAAPTKWIVEGSRAGGCSMALSAPQLEIRKVLTLGENVIEFTAPEKPGTYSFSCSMGMYRGAITVVKG